MTPPDTSTYFMMGGVRRKSTITAVAGEARREEEELLRCNARHRNLLRVERALLGVDSTRLKLKCLHVIRYRLGQHQPLCSSNRGGRLKWGNKTWLLMQWLKQILSLIPSMCCCVCCTHATTSGGSESCCTCKEAAHHQELRTSLNQVCASLSS